MHNMGWRATPGCHQHRIETQRILAKLRVRCKIILRRVDNALLIVAMDGFRRVARRCSRFHFDKRDRAAALCDKVYLAARGFVAPRQNTVSLQLQPERGDCFRPNTAAMAAAALSGFVVHLSASARW